jgi:hypothetical protein
MEKASANLVGVFLCLPQRKTAKIQQLKTESARAVRFSGVLLSDHGQLTQLR